MKKQSKFALTIAVVLAGIALAVWWIDRPRRITEESASHLFHERCKESALMVCASSAIKMAVDSKQILVDDNGNSSEVLATKLPFKAGGDKLDRISDFTITLFGNRTNEVLDSPRVIIYLSIKVERSESTAQICTSHGAVN